MNVDKNTVIPIATMVALFGVFSWFTDKIETKADKEKMERIAQEVDQEENMNIQQQGQIQATAELLEKLDKRFQKALE